MNITINKKIYSILKALIFTSVFAVLFFGLSCYSVKAYYSLTGGSAPLEISSAGNVLGGGTHQILFNLGASYPVQDFECTPSYSINQQNIAGGGVYLYYRNSQCAWWRNVDGANNPNGPWTPIINLGFHAAVYDIYFFFNYNRYGDNEYNFFYDLGARRSSSWDYNSRYVTNYQYLRFDSGFDWDYNPSTFTFKTFDTRTYTWYPDTVPPPPTVYLSSGSNPVNYGSVTNLYWTSSNNNSGCVTSGNGSTISWPSYYTSGSFSSGNLISNPTSFSLSCTGSGGSAAAYKTISVVMPTPVTIDILNASPRTVITGNTSTISWSSTGANYCDMYVGSNYFTSGVSGSKTSASLSTSTVYTLYCANNYNSVTGTITVDVMPPAPTIRLEGEEIVWTADGATCTLTKGGGTPIVLTGQGGTIIRTEEDILAGVEYVLICTSNGNSLPPQTLTVLPVIKSTCAPSQTFVNRNTTWTIEPYASGTTITNRIWSGTNVSETSGPTLNKIYTTVGLKYINATTTGIHADGITPFTSSCYATTTMKLDPGTGGEI